jgi:hypothetical protein
MAKDEDVQVKDNERTYAMPDDTIISGMRSGKGQVLLMYRKAYEKAVNSEDGILGFFQDLFGEDADRAGGLKGTKIKITQNTTDANGFGIVVANLDFPKGFGEARDDESPLASVFISRRKDQPLLVIFGLNYGMADDKGQDIPLVYPSDYNETHSLFAPKAP